MRQCRQCGVMNPESEYRKKFRGTGRDDLCNTCKYRNKLARAKESHQRHKEALAGDRDTYDRLIDHPHMPWRPTPRDTKESALLRDCLLAGVVPRDDREWEAMCLAAVSGTKRG